MSTDAISNFEIYYTVLSDVGVLASIFLMILLIKIFPSKLYIASVGIYVLSRIALITYQCIYLITTNVIGWLYTVYNYVSFTALFLVLIAIGINFGKIMWSNVWRALKGSPQFVFFLLAIVLFVAVAFTGFTLNQSSETILWVEQGMNVTAVICLCAGSYLVVSSKQAHKLFDPYAVEKFEKQKYLD